MSSNGNRRRVQYIKKFLLKIRSLNRHAHKSSSLFSWKHLEPFQSPLIWLDKIQLDKGIYTGRIKVLSQRSFTPSESDRNTVCLMSIESIFIQVVFTFTLALCKYTFRVRLYWGKSKSDITSRWIHREPKLMFTLGSDKGQRNKFALALMNAP